ncbi:MAG: hypothetical protein KAJ01_01930, partial [Candidatus Hydrogenedentes bacterium]|nr:hypothetical protein [Candidatus Hydrogenedentota bacterium]
HGHIAALGFELYCQLVEEAARELRGEKVKRRILPVVDLGIDAYLPDQYIPSPAQKIAFYKRISAAQTQKQLDEIGEELADRYGPLPPEAQRLMATMSLRLMGADTGVELVGRARNMLLFKFRRHIEPDRSTLHRLITRYQQKTEVEFDGSLRFTVKLTDNREEEILSTARDVLEEIVAAR